MFSPSEKNKTDMESDDSNSEQGELLGTFAVITSVVCTFFMVVAVSVSLTLFYCHCCHGRRRRRDLERTVDVESLECGEPSPPLPVGSLGPVAFQPQGQCRRNV